MTQIREVHKKYSSIIKEQDHKRYVNRQKVLERKEAKDAEKYKVLKKKFHKYQGQDEDAERKHTEKMNKNN